MKFSYRWIAELVDGLATPPEDLERLVTVKTAECEAIEAVGTHFTGVFAARILSVESLPNGRNKAVRIDVGNKKEVTVVCGAPNVRPGLLAPWIRPGVSLDGKLIDLVMIDGVESEGMLASAAELRINRDHSGLLELRNVQPGDPLPGLSPDWVIDIDNKSLTHRPDLWGHHGMAREVAAITQRQLIDPVDMNLLPKGIAQFSAQIVDPALCSRYSGLTFTGVQVGPSPLWLQARLQNIGLNPINNIVDVTNYVLAELPQPMHAFDADKLAGETIYVRTARRGERLIALNGDTYELSETDLVIADASGPVALAGVIGGADTAISESTTRIFLESANFQAARIRSTSSRHKLRTDASMRFEKSLDPHNTLRGLARAVRLFRDVCPGIYASGGVTDTHTVLTPALPIALSTDFVVRKLGNPISTGQIVDILSSLGFGSVETAPGMLVVTVPSWRATKDISVEDDLVEEIGRMLGYDEIIPTPPTVATVVPPVNHMRLYVRKLRRELADQGFTEVYNYSFTGTADVQDFGLPIQSHLALKNPIAAELTHLRSSLIPGLFKNVVSNVRNYSDFRMFEIGNEVNTTGKDNLAQESTHAAAALYDAHGNEQDFFELKRVLNCLFPSIHLKAAAARTYEHPARTAEIEWYGSVIGRIFELHPSMLEAEDIEGRAVLFDVDVCIAQEVANRGAIKYTPVRKFPTSGFDLSVVTDLRTPVSDIQGKLTEFAGPNLARIEFVRQYDRPPLPSGQKSVTYHLEIGALTHTVTTEEVTEVRNRIIADMQNLGFDFRA